MLWRVRANLSDRPGTLAALASECGRAGVNIRAIQMFPGQAVVTMELVVVAPQDWDSGDLIRLVVAAGADSVVALHCSEAALEDQPTRYVRAALDIIDHPESFPEVVARLFDADLAPTAGSEDVLEMSIGNATIQIRRTTPFTTIERKRGAAMAELLTHVVERTGMPTPMQVADGGEPEYVVADDSVSALVAGRVAGRASVASAAPPDPWPVDLWVDPNWQRRGIGTRLLADIARLARQQGAEEIVLTAPADNRAVLPMVLSAGLRGRIRMAGETVTVRIAVSELRV